MYNTCKYKEKKSSSCPNNLTKWRRQGFGGKELLEKKDKKA